MWRLAQRMREEEAPNNRREERHKDTDKRDIRGEEAGGELSFISQYVH